MNARPEQRDLICLVADRNSEASLEAILRRPQSLAIRPVTFVIRTHPEKDPGCYLKGHSFLRPFRGRYRHAVVMFDREGCGGERLSRAELEGEVEGRLQVNGWNDRARVVVIDPELESWVWSDSPEVERALGWAGRSPVLRSWLSEKGFFREGIMKPERPKEAVEAALRVVHKPRSSAIYQDLATSVSLWRCSDPAFARLRAALQGWFPLNDTHEKRDMQ